MHATTQVDGGTGRPITRSGVAALLFAASALVCGCQKSAADNAPGAGAAAMPVEVLIAPSVKIPETSEYLSILKSLDEQVKQQKVELHYYSVTSPRDGIIGDIPVRVGDRVSVSTLLTTVDEPGALEAYIYVPAERARSLKTGLPVRILDDNNRAGIETHISFVSPQVDTDTQTVLAKAAFENSQAKLRVAQQVTAQITWGIHEGPVIPVLAVLRINGQFFAFVAVNEGKGTVARQKPLKLGDTVGNDFVVLDGLKPGDHVIVSGTQFLQDGTPVTEQIQSKGQSSSGR